MIALLSFVARATSFHGQGTTVCGRAIRSWSGRSRTEFEVNLPLKDRRALGDIGAAEQAGQLSPGQTVIEATSGNTGIGLAMVRIFWGAKLRPLDAT